MRSLQPSKIHPTARVDDSCCYVRDAQRGRLTCMRFHTEINKRLKGKKCLVVLPLVRFIEARFSPGGQILLCCRQDLVSPGGGCGPGSLPREGGRGVEGLGALARAPPSEGRARGRARGGAGEGRPAPSARRGRDPSRGGAAGRPVAASRCLGWGGRP